MIALSTLLLILLPLTACHVKVHLHARADNATASSAASDQPKASTAPCVRGNNIGSIYVTQPNISSYVFVGNNAIVEWRYSPNVKNKPKTVDIIVYRESNPTTSQTVIVGGLDVSNGATAWRWHVNQLPAGVYKLHIVPDGKETMGKTQNQLPCFVNGDSLPGTSGAFSISQLQPLASFPDRFPPNKMGAARGRFEACEAICLALLLLLLL